MSRPTSGVKMLDPLPGTPEAKARLAAIIASISGGKSIPQVCDELGICEARFHAMRKEFLEEAVLLLEKRSAGRKPAEEESAEHSRLRDEIGRLRFELEAAQIKAEIAMVMPHVLKPSGASKKTEGRKPRR